MTTDAIAALAAHVKALPPSARLRLAAELLERRQPELARALVEGVAAELRLMPEVRT